LPDRDTIKLRLSREGLDIIFKSREIYQDLRFSVMQFYLDQQIRRGTFEGALETVKELGVAVTEHGAGTGFPAPGDPPQCGGGSG